jgi:hypothetical protein
LVFTKVRDQPVVKATSGVPGVFTTIVDEELCVHLGAKARNAKLAIILKRRETRRRAFFSGPFKLFPASTVAIESSQRRLASAVGFGGSFPYICCDSNGFYLGNQANSSTTRASFFNAVCWQFCWHCCRSL